jgi:hypothetical protein
LAHDNKPDDNVLLDYTLFYVRQTVCRVIDVRQKNNQSLLQYDTLKNIKLSVIGPSCAAEPPPPPPYNFSAANDIQSCVSESKPLFLLFSALLAAAHNICRREKREGKKNVLQRRQI